jgi:hypothetical protein
MTARIESRVGRALVMLDEAFEIKRKALGTVPFKQTSLQDPHIQQIISDTSAVTGSSVQEITQYLQKKMAEIEQMKKYSPILYEIAAKNAAETAVFDFIVHSRARAHKHLVSFDPLVFNQLLKLVRRDHRQFFPLRQPGDTSRYVFNFNPILVPTTKKELQKFNRVDTAAATAKGEFIFNTEFMQKLLDWAAMEGVRPNGAKYQSNGGPIPDAYCYIEFLIVHELLHYSYGDFNYGIQMPEFTHMIHNYASDFRSNYMLVKSGYPQLPIGLFSDDVNADRQGSYREMAQLVSDELKKLPPPLQKTFQDLAGLDQHTPSDGDPGGEPPPSKGEGKGKQQIAPGSVVRNKSTGEYYRVDEVRDGKLVTQRATPEEIKAAQGNVSERAVHKRAKI